VTDIDMEELCVRVMQDPKVRQMMEDAFKKGAEAARNAQAVAGPASPSGKDQAARPRAHRTFSATSL